MSILFDANTEGIHYTDAALTALDAKTIIMVYKVPDNTVSGITAFKERTAASGTADWHILRSSIAAGPDDWQFFTHRATTTSFLRSSGNIIQSARWEWVAFFEDAISVGQIVHGALSGTPIEVAYTLQQQGVGALGASGTTELMLGNDVALANSANLIIDSLGIWNRRMTVAEALTHHPKIHNSSGCKLLIKPGRKGVVGADDYSPNRMAHVVDGVPTVSADAPIPSRYASTNVSANSMAGGMA